MVPKIKYLKNEHGLSLVIVMMMVTLLLTLTAIGLMTAGTGFKTASNLQTATTALHVADAGMQHALALIPHGTDFHALLTGSVSSFPCFPSPPCNGTTSKPTLTYSLNNYAYNVVIDNDTSVSGETGTHDGNNTVLLTSTATGTDGTTKKIGVT